MLNAELIRHVCTEVNWQRLLFVPFVALLILYLTRLDAPDNDSDYHLWFTLFAAGWGSFGLIWSIKEERNNNTWYWQQLTPLTPLQLLTGKLAGALLLPWLGGLLILLPALPSAETLSVILSAAFINLGAFFITLITIRDGRVNMAVALFATLAMAVILINFPGSDDDRLMQWYGWPLPLNMFVCTALAAYALWAGAGCHHLLRREKRCPERGWLFPAFMLFYLGYGCGLAENILPAAYAGASPALTYITVIWLMLLSALYVSAFLCGGGGALLLIDSLKQRGRRALHVPPWLWIYPALLLATAAYWIHPESNSDIGWQATAMILYASRDIALLLIFTLRRRAVLPEGICLVVLAVLYLLLPLLLEETGAGRHWLSPYDLAQAADLKLSAVSALAQCLLAAALLWRLRLASYWRR